MATKMRRNFSGAFLARDLGHGAWQLCGPPPREINVFVHGAEQSARRSFATGPISDLGMEWHEEKVLLTFKSQHRVASVEAASALVHEPLPSLYERLPLPGIDAGARRFWNRVFLLMRLPGGRYLLKVLSRSRTR